MDQMLCNLFRCATTCQWDLLRAIADRYEETNDQLRATGFRWLADNRRWPYEEMRWRGEPPATYKVEWVWENNYEGDGTDTSRLPLDLFEWAKDPSGGFPSLEVALNVGAEAVGRWLEKTGGDPCNRCDGTGRTWKYDSDSSSKMAVKCRTCKGDGRRKPKQSKRENQEVT